MTDTPRGWGLRISGTARFLALVGAATAAGTLACASFGLIPPIQGFTWFTYSVLVAAGALFVSLIALCIHAVKKSASMGQIGFAWLLAAPLVGYAAFFIAQAQKVPALHDVTTDLANPPQFSEIKLRDDLNQVVPDGGRAELKALTPAQRRARLHAEAYADLRPVMVPMAIPLAVERLTAQARARGWDVVLVDVTRGRVEATETVSLFGFKDDIVFRVTPDPADDRRSIVDARSVSRVGISDVGVNARRIRTALSELTAK
ncbi:MAG: DUF1499 domain-containing protein [Sphingopyxis sp.]|nr:DUF1499 domain-containing protein [Sphingopyxis sp.]